MFYTVSWDVPHADYTAKVRAFSLPDDAACVCLCKPTGRSSVFYEEVCIHAAHQCDQVTSS